MGEEGATYLADRSLSTDFLALATVHVLQGTKLMYCFEICTILLQGYDEYVYLVCCV